MLNPHLIIPLFQLADLSWKCNSLVICRSKGFKGSRKSTPYAAQIAADEAATKALGVMV